MAPKPKAARKRKFGGVGPELDIEVMRKQVLDASYRDLRKMKWDIDVPDRVRLAGNAHQTRIDGEAFRDNCLRRVEHAKGRLDLSSWGQEAPGGGVGPATYAHYFWFNTADDAATSGMLPDNFVEGMLSSSRIGLHALLWCYPAQVLTNVPPQAERRDANAVFHEEAVRACLAHCWPIALVADLVRWLVVWHFGGWFVDGDMLWLRPFPVAWGHPHYGHHFASMEATHRRGTAFNLAVAWAAHLYLRHPRVKSWIATPAHYPRGSPFVHEAISAALSLVPDSEGRMLDTRERQTDAVPLGPVVADAFTAAYGGGVGPATDPWASWRRLKPLLKLKGNPTCPPEYLTFMELTRCLVTRWGLEGAVEAYGSFSPLRNTLKDVTTKPPEEFVPEWRLAYGLGGACGLDSILGGAYGVNCFWSSAWRDASESQRRGSLGDCAPDSLWGQIRCRCQSLLRRPRPLGTKDAFEGKLAEALERGRSSERQLAEERQHLAEALERGRSSERQLAEERQHRAELKAFFRRTINSVSTTVVLEEMPVNLLKWIDDEPEMTP